LVHIRLRTGRDVARAAASIARISTRWRTWPDHGDPHGS